MKDLLKTCKVAVVQATPVLFNKEKTIAKAAALIQEAGNNGANLIVFPEVFIAGYPRGLSFGTVVAKRTKEGREDWQKYYASSMILPSPDSDKIAEAAKEAEIYVGLGYTERDPVNCTLYCSFAIFGPDGKVLSNHRKLKGTGLERCIWGEGRADLLKTVDTPYGPIGGLCCWENMMPLARFALYQQGITIYMAAHNNGGLELWQCSMRHIAMEGRCFVVTTGCYITKAEYKKMYADAGLNYTIDDKLYPQELLCAGGGSIIGPDGNYVVKPVCEPVDLIYGTLDMDQVAAQRMDFDVTGHYSRPDVFHFSIND